MQLITVQIYCSQHDPCESLLKDALVHETNFAVFESTVYIFRNDTLERKTADMALVNPHAMISLSPSILPIFYSNGVAALAAGFDFSHKKKIISHESSGSHFVVLWRTHVCISLFYF